MGVHLSDRARQAHELPDAPPLVERLPGVPKWVVVDRGYTNYCCRLAKPEGIYGMDLLPWRSAEVRSLTAKLKRIRVSPCLDA